MLWFIIWNIYLVFVPVRGTEVLKLLELPVQGAIEVSCDKVTFRKSLKMPVEPTQRLESWNFQASPPISLAGKWDEDSVVSGQWFNQSHLWGSLHRNLEEQGSQDFWVDNVKGDLGKVAHLERAWKPPAPSQCFVLCISSIWLFLSYILLWLTGNPVSLGSVSCFRRGSLELRLVRSTGDILNVWLVSGFGGGEQS